MFLAVSPNYSLCVSLFLSPPLFRPKDYSPEGFIDWAFMTTHMWDEDPRGEWTLEIENVSEQGHDYGKRTSVYLHTPPHIHQMLRPPLL